MFRIFFGLSLFCLLSLNSCQYSNYTYVQTPLNVPDLKKRGDAQADIYVSVKGIDLQTSYALSHHLAMMANANYNFLALNQGHKASTNTFAMDVAAGYFNSKNKNTFSLYAGLGVGDISNYGKSERIPFSLGYSRWDNSSHYQKLFIQSSFTRQVSERFTLAFALRASAVRYDSYAYKFARYTGSDKRRLQESIDTLEINTPGYALVFDPAIVMNFRCDARFSMYAQLGLVGGIGLGSLTERKEIDFTNHQSYTSKVSSSSQASRVQQPVIFPFSLYAGLRFRISR
ncbi:MAG: hypothetical protein K0R51_3398 [Cytophagaceae bacterium]|nr:hypothetical protein [Cytophagaceae bacterium]